MAHILLTFLFFFGGMCVYIGLFWLGLKWALNVDVHDGSQSCDCLIY